MKKVLTIHPHEFEVGDYIRDIGTVKAVGRAHGDRDDTPFAYEPVASKELIATAWSNIYEYDVLRGVEEPQTKFELRSCGGDTVTFEWDSNVNDVDESYVCVRPSRSSNTLLLDLDDLAEVVDKLKGLRG